MINKVLAWNGMQNRGSGVACNGVIEEAGNQFSKVAGRGWFEVLPPGSLYLPSFPGRSLSW